VQATGLTIYALPAAIAALALLGMAGVAVAWWLERRRYAIGFAQWVKLDLQYIDTWSLSEDFKILLKTLPAVMRGTGH
jgi:lipopolysaccharide/colanic/teichoic acid biosynthesis glycosyltransferase